LGVGGGPPFSAPLSFSMLSLFPSAHPSSNEYSGHINQKHPTSRPFSLPAPPHPLPLSSPPLSLSNTFPQAVHARTLPPSPATHAPALQKGHSEGPHPTNMARKVIQRVRTKPGGLTSSYAHPHPPLPFNTRTSSTCRPKTNHKLLNREHVVTSAQVFLLLFSTTPINLVGLYYTYKTLTPMKLVDQKNGPKLPSLRPAFSRGTAALWPLPLPPLLSPQARLRRAPPDGHGGPGEEDPGGGGWGGWGGIQLQIAGAGSEIPNCLAASPSGSKGAANAARRESRAPSSSAASGSGLGFVKQKKKKRRS
jgi:hypothetical protein